MSNKEKLNKIRVERLKRGKDILPRSYDRILTAILRHNKFVEDVCNADFVDDTKGQWGTFNIFTFGIIAFITVVLFGGMIYVTGLLNTTFVNIGHQNEGSSLGVNLTEASENTFGKMNLGIQALRMVAIAIIFSEILGFIVVAAFSRKHPAMFFVYVLIVFLAVMFAAPISNAYESLLRDNVMAGTLNSFTGGNWILLHLPLFTLLVGILGGIFMFINIVRGGTEEGL